MTTRKEDNMISIFQTLLVVMLLSGALSTPPEIEPSTTITTDE